VIAERVSGTVRSRPLQLVSGIRGHLVRFRFRVYVLASALTIYRDPLIAHKVLRGLINKKRATEGSLQNPRRVKADGRYYWSVSTPGWPSEAFNRYLRYEMNRIQPFTSAENLLQTMIWSITTRCPLACEHCYEWNNLSAKESLSLQDLKDILRKFQKYGITNIQLSGGEPLSRFDDLIDLLNSAQTGTDFWILTSGFGLTAEKASSLKQAGLKGIVISLDHWKEEEHNRFRKHEKSYSWVFEAARNALAAGLVVSLSLCATKSFITFENLSRYLHLAQVNGISMIRILEPRETGHYQGQDVELEEAQIRLLESFYLRSVCDPLFRNSPVIEYVAYHQRRIGCFGAGDRYLYIDSKGDIHACPFCQNPVANALTDPVESSLARLREVGCHKYHRHIPEDDLALSEQGRPETNEIHG